MNRILHLLVISVFLTCCTVRSNYVQTVNENAEQLYGKRVNLLSNLVMEDDIDSEYIIVSRINGNCHPCLDQLKAWKSLIKEWRKYPISYRFYVVTQDRLVFEGIQKEDAFHDCSLIFDPNNQFMKENKIPQDILFHTLLLDEDNKIIAIGNPLDQPEIKSLFVKTLNK